MFQLPAENVLIRSSSRSPEKGASSLKRLRDLERERKECNDEAKAIRKKLKFTTSFDAEYWTTRRDLADKQIQATILTRQISIASMKDQTKDNTKEFVESEAGQRSLMQEESLKLDRKLFHERAQKLGSNAKDSNFRRSFVQLFIGAETGLGIENSRGQRDSRLQSAFRSELIVKMGATNPNRKSELWCPVRNIYCDEEVVVAGHLFPWKFGEATMEAIFGRSDSGHSELFKAENGILWSTRAEERFEKGLFVIVPDVPDQPTEEQLHTWQASDPKEYKIRVLNPKHKLMELDIRDKTWADLDNERLYFKRSFRPRARYLYFAYCVAMLRRSFGGKHLEVSKSELGKGFWGTPGRYMLEGMLLGFVEEMGHGYKNLLEGAIKEDKAVPDSTAVAIANQGIQRSLKADEEEASDSDSDSDDDKDNNDAEDDSERYTAL